MKTITTKQGTQGTLTVDSKAQTAILEVNGTKHTIAFVRDAKKVVIKNDMMLSDADLTMIKNEMQAFIKKADTSAKKRK